MPIQRSSKLPSENSMVVAFEGAIRSLVLRFRQHPYLFYTETDMHCYLYHRLYSRGLFNGLYTTKEKRDTILLHKEYPTDVRYDRNADKSFKENLKGRRGHYDICIWDPVYIAHREHRKQKVLFAAELALNECGPNNVHTINDATKLADCWR